MNKKPQKAARETPENLKAEVLAGAAEGLKPFIAVYCDGPDVVTARPPRNLHCGGQDGIERRSD